MPGTADEKAYVPEELAHNLMDWIDVDDQRLEGGAEDDSYLAREPAYRAANTPLLAIDDLGLVEGFDPALVEALRPYVGVYPLAGGNGNQPEHGAAVGPRDPLPRDFGRLPPRRDRDHPAHPRHSRGGRHLVRRRGRPSGLHSDPRRGAGEPVPPADVDEPRSSR